MNKLLLNTIVVLAGAFNLMAADVSQTYEVGPGKNGSYWITQSGKVGEKLTVSFTPKSDYEFTRNTQCDDQTKAGWRPNGGPHTYRVQCTKEHSKEDQRAVFSGMVRVLAEAGKGSPPPELPWDLAGFFKVLRDHEGFGEDWARGGAGFVSEKKNAPPIYEGEARWDEATRTFIGTFSEGGASGFTGFHKGYPDMKSKAWGSLCLVDRYYSAPPPS